MATVQKKSLTILKPKFIFLCLLGSLFLICTVLKLPCYRYSTSNLIQGKSYFSLTSEDYLCKNKEAKRRLPQCIIIGVRKCGTRALLEFLNISPHIEMAFEEVHFFDNDTNYSKGIQWYCEQMPISFPGQITIEKSPKYFTTASVPKRIKEMNANIKLLLIVREPVLRIISDYTQICSYQIIKKKPCKPLETLVFTVSGEVNTRYTPIKISLYYQHMQLWLKEFLLEQIHIINGDQLITDPILEIQKTEDFLGLQRKISRENFYFNDTKGFYCVRKEMFQECLGNTKGRLHPSISQKTIRKLRRFFHPHNLKFYKMIGRNFNWPSK